MNKTTLPPLKKQCPYCQAGNHPAADQCWLCHAPLPKPTGGVTTLPPPPPPGHDAPDRAFFEIYFAILFFLALGAMGVVLVGSFLTEPSLGMIALVGIVPVVLVTGIAMALRYSSTGKVDFLRGVLAMAITALVTVCLAILLIVGGIVFLFILCLREISSL